MKKISYKRAWPLYRRLLSYVKPFWKILLLGIVANIIYSGIDASLTYMMRPFLDKGFVDVDMQFVKTIPYIILIGIIARGLVSSLGSYSMTWVARSVVKTLRQKVFAHIVHLPARDYDRSTAGQFLSKILYDVEQVAQVSADALTDFVQNTCLIIGLMVVMFVVCWSLSLMFLLTVPLVGLLVNYTNKRVRRISHQVQQTMGKVTEIASEAIDGYKVVRIFGGEEREMHAFNKATEASRRNDMKVAFSKAVNVFGVQFIIAIGIAAIIFTAIKMVDIINITAGSFLVVIAAMLQLIKPLKTLTTLNAAIQRGLAGAESVFLLLDKPIESKVGKTLAANIRNKISFKNVSYSYNADETILHDVNFTINAGETVALVGHSGSGKSTIASLIPRFYEINRGMITIDGVPIAELSLQYLRSQIALVSQEVVLFNDSIANNIAYGKLNAQRSDIIRAAKLADADGFIQALAQGYDTPIGENGVFLSGGQRQRLAIARAILKDAPILILDEATSALDAQSERRVQSALDQVMTQRTTIIIAHRLSTIQKANQIIVMQHGRIVEKGTHQQLIALNNHYAKLYSSQEVGISSHEVAYS